ncbi:putative transcriptional regulator with C-terminal CBS domains [Thioflavicoccus mobilis 8321]|uniref:Putative transcriptional regulator with C-terminal CBS domains n=1 Tax=Thioflavicoccus mobilis 8321 TaxID=765912 RepID=L0H1F1_9GAMM|nr:helix-turn-helix domain-containing protein [Thioflavicoccus mobilis]AGA91882.1 putative transcriptional regulator with C-terminal CBS domains [Thioflavicoccus mobilis 8321]
MITAPQLRAARALLGIDQRTLARLAGLSLPTIQRMEASDGQIRGHVDSLVKVVEALERAGLELIGEGATNAGGGRGVRLKTPAAAALDATAEPPDAER